MATRTISTKLAVEGEAQYKQAIAACNSELKTLKSDLALVESEFRNSANSMEALTAKGDALSALFEAQKDKVAKLEDALSNAQRAYDEYGTRVATAQDNIQRYEQQLEQLKNSTGDTTEEQEALTAELDKWNAELEEAQAGQAAAARGVQDWQTKLNSAKIELNGLSDETEQNARYLAEAKESADGCATSIDKYGKEIKEAGASSEEFAEGTQQSKQGIEQLAAALAAAGVAKTVKEIADVLIECANAAAGFETAMAKVSTLADTTAVPLESLKSELMALSNETGVAASALAEAAYQALSAGVDTADVATFVSTATKASVAGFTDSATAVDVLTTAINAYNLEGAEAERVASMLVKTQDEGKTSVGELAQNMGRIIPTAAAYNVSLENLTTSYALLTKSGTNTAIATTNLSAMFTELAKDGSSVANILQEQTGKSFAELTDSGTNLGEIMEILSASVDGDATAFSNLWSSSTAGKAALALLNSGAEEFTRTMGVMETSSGAVEKNFQTMADTTEFAHQRMANAAENLKIAVGDQLNPVLEKLYTTGADAFTWATDFVTENPGVVSAIVGATTALGALSLGVAGLAAAPAIIGTLNTALTLLAANPVVGVTAAVVGLVAAVGTWAASLDDADESTQNFIDSLQDTKTAYEDMTSTMAEQRTSTEAVAASLHDLLAVEEKSALQKDLIQQKVDQLNEAVPGLGLAYDKEKDSLVGLTEAELDSMLSRAAAQEEYEAQVTRLNELSNEQAEIEARLTEARLALNEAQETGSGNTRTLQNDIDALTAAQEANAAQIAELEAASSAYAEQQAEADRKTQEMTATVEGLITEMEELQAAYEESYSAAKENIESQLGLFNELDGTAKTSTGNLIDTLKGQVEYMETYAANIQKAMEMGVDEGLVKKLSDGSEESAQILAAIVQGGEEDIAALNEQLANVEEGKKNFSDTVAEMETDFNRKMSELVQDLDQAIQDMNVKDEAYKIGQNNITGLIQGTADQRRQLVETYAQMGRDALAAYKREVGQASPSKKFKEVGRFDIQGLIGGVEEETPKLAAAYENLAQTALDSMERRLPSAALLPDYGPDVDYSSLMLAAETLEEFEQYAAQRTAKIIGEHIDLVEQGYADNAQLLKQWMQTVDTTAQNIEETLQGIDYDPDVDYSSLMLAAETLEEFEQYAAQRTAKIIGEHIDLVEQGYADNAQLLDQWMESVGVTAQDVEGIIQNIEKTIQSIDYDPDVDYSSLMLAAKTLEEFEQYAAQRTAKIIGEHMDLVEQGYADNAQLLKQWMGSVDTTAQNIEEILQGIDYDPDVDYSSLMLAAETLEEFEQYAAQRTAKIIGEHIDTVAQGYEENAKILEQWRAAVDNTMAGIEKSVNGVVYDPDVDYSALMMEAQSLEEFLALANQRTAKIMGENIDVVGKGYADNVQLLEQWNAAVRDSRDDLVGAVDEMASEFSQKMEEMTQSLNDAIEEMNVAEEAFLIGENNVRGLIDGTASMRDELVETYAQMGRDALAAYKREVGQASPSKKFKEVGRFDIQGLIGGVEEEAPRMAAAYEEAAQAALASMERHLPSTVVEPSSSAAMDRQTAAIVSAVSGRESAGESNPIYVDKLVVRDDSDIQRIAQELYYLTHRENRSRGGGSL